MPTPLTRQQYEHLIAPRPYLWWGIADKTALSSESVVEGILGRGNWDDVKALFKELGIKQVKDIFENQTCGLRTNYRPRTINFFTLYFKRHV